MDDSTIFLTKIYYYCNSMPKKLQPQCLKADEAKGVKYTLAIKVIVSHMDRLKIIITVWFHPLNSILCNSTNPQPSFPSSTS